MGNENYTPLWVLSEFLQKNFSELDISVVSAIIDIVNDCRQQIEVTPEDSLEKIDNLLIAIRDKYV